VGDICHSRPVAAVGWSRSIRWHIAAWCCGRQKVAPNEVQSTPRHSYKLSNFPLGKIYELQPWCKLWPDRSRIRISCQVHRAIVRLRPFASWQAIHADGRTDTRVDFMGFTALGHSLCGRNFLSKLKFSILVVVSVCPESGGRGATTAISRYKSCRTIWAIPVCTRCLTCMGNCRQHF